MKKRDKIDLTKVIRCTCAVCGDPGAEIHPYPLPVGTCWCPKCSPCWLKDFLSFQAEKAASVT